LPNIVFVLADDLGYGDLGCYNDESLIPTPHLDRLASQGLRFTDAHTPSSVCTPTRYGFLTGRYCWRSRMKRSVLWPWDPPLIEADRLTLPAMLGKKGYRTACIGKWHLGWDWPLQGGGYITDEFSGFTIPKKQRDAFGKRIDFARPTRGGPTDRGFDYYFGDDVPNFPPYSFLENRQTVGLPTADKPNGMFGHIGPALPGWDLSLVLPTLAQRAASYIEEQAKTADEPFFLFMPLTAPHTPIAPSPHFIGKSKAGWYGDFVHEVDWVVGQVLAALERSGQTNDTLVFFTSDNGSPQRDGTNMVGPTGSVKANFGHDPSRPWRGMKSDAWEAGHRVPFIVRWPGRVAAGQVTGEPIILTDCIRTIAGLVGFALPENAAEDSFDFRHVLEGKKRKAGTPGRDHLIHHSGSGLFAVRQGEWKLIFGKGSGGFSRYKPPADAPKGQLYNLKADPGERNNLYREQPEVVSRLTALLDQAQQLNRTYPGR
jgi:arylsulfatase A-like enzyme